MKTNVYKPIGKKSLKKPKSNLNNKWFIVGGVILLAVAGIIAIRVSQAAGRFAQNCLVVVESGRQPETGTPFIEYEACGSNGTVYLRKSTNGEIRTAGFGDAEAVGMQMYEEMIAAQNTPAPTPPPSTPNSTVAPSTSNASSTTTPSASTSPASSSQQTNSAEQNSSSSNTTTPSKNSSSTTIKKFLITLRRKVNIAPKIPEGIGKISSVVLLVDGNKIAESKTPNYLIMLDTTKLSNGTHTLTTQIVNESGSIIGADSYTIKIDNTNSWIDKLLWIFGY